jgi:hypothetical protein
MVAATATAPRPARRGRTAQPALSAPAPQAAVQPTTETLAVPDAGMAPIATLQALKWFAKIDQPQQAVVIEETVGLAEDLHTVNEGMLNVGERLTKLQGILEPHNIFNRYLAHFHFSKRTAYRWIAKFKNAATLPEPILRLAMARNIPIGGENDQKPYGTYTDAVRKLPPPRNPSNEQAATWLEQVQQVAKEGRSAGATNGAPSMTLPEPTDPTTAMKEAFRFVMNRYNQLPNNSRSRANWLKGLFGMLLSAVGIAGPQQFAPQPVPAEFAAGRGRPANPTTQAVA